MTRSQDRPKLRCAIYTRKSSEERLDQAFNSLDAQRDACAAYIRRQAAEGWEALPDLYDDGGFSGGSMDRPGLQRLLQDIAAGRVDVVVVYKIDRLTRALADFARILELFDRQAVSFVSVTQAFNTTTSMGRLTLNVLLSFAQFEREVTGERIRDKIAASKACGLWMGGTLPLGYDAAYPGGERVLTVNTTEAETVRAILRSNLDLGSVTELLDVLRTERIVSKRQTRRDGRISGGDAFSRGALFYLLRNRTYRDEIVHKGNTYPGRHEASVDEALFDAVQQRLDLRSRRGSDGADRKIAVGSSSVSAPSESWLTGRIVDAEGEGMSPTTAQGRGGRRFRYYVSRSLQQGRIKRAAGQAGGQRVSAPALEARVSEILRRLELPEAPDHWPALRRLEHGRDYLALILEAEIDDLSPLLAGAKTLSEESTARSCVRLVHPMTHHRRGYRSVLASTADRPRPDAALIAGLRAAHACVQRDQRGLPIADGALDKPYARRRMRLAFLAPDIQQSILQGRQPLGLTLARLMAAEIPFDWDEQRAMITALSQG